MYTELLFEVIKLLKHKRSKRSINRLYRKYIIHRMKAFIDESKSYQVYYNSLLDFLDVCRLTNTYKGKNDEFQFEIKFDNAPSVWIKLINNDIISLISMRVSIKPMVDIKTILSNGNIEEYSVNLDTDLNKKYINKILRLWMNDTMKDILDNYNGNDLK